MAHRVKNYFMVGPSALVDRSISALTISFTFPASQALSLLNSQNENSNINPLFYAKKLKSLLSLRLANRRTKLRVVPHIPKVENFTLAPTQTASYAG